MVLIEHLSGAADDPGQWRVSSQDLAGNIVADFRSQSADLAVGFALAAIQSARQLKNLGSRTPALVRHPLAAQPNEAWLQRHRHRITDTAIAHVRGINRVGSRMPQAASIQAATCGQRMAQRRLELSLTQVDVAAQVVLTSKSGKQKDAKRRLSRNAYCMYELDSAEPNLSTIAQIADALHVSPAWLAFGD